MKISIDLSKSLQENAGLYFDKSKKAKKKLKGLEIAIDNTKKKLKKKKSVEIKKEKIKRKIYWYEKFRWFFTSDGFLCIGGRDATSNEIIIKKHTSPGDIVFHTDMAGSPFIVIKSDGKKIPITSIEEAAQFTASMSRAWKMGLGTLDVFYVNPEQVTKDARAGESLSRGAFVIKGETNYLRPNLELGACLRNNTLMIAPLITFKDELVNYGMKKNKLIKENLMKDKFIDDSVMKDKLIKNKIIKIFPGKTKVSDGAKLLMKELPGNYNLDEAIRLMPPGSVKIICKN